MVSLLSYHATVNSSGAHAIATLHGAAQVHVRLDDGSTAALSLHDVCLAGPTQDAAFRQAVQTVAHRARLALPENTERIADAVELVLNGAVELTAPGYGTVASRTTEGLRYQTNGTCECKDFPRAPAHFCAHRLALGIVQRVMEAEEEAERNTGDASGTTPEHATQETTDAPVASTALPEAPASANCYITLHGRQVQVTLRDTCEARLLQRLAAVLAPYPLPDAAPRITSPLAAPQNTAGWCALHHAAMKEQTNVRGSWWSHKLAEGGYCKGHK